MDIFRASERLMSMDDAAWARHANPWSVYSRFTVLPLIALAIWSRAWLGWGALIPLALALFWAWWNPRAFPPATDLTTWAAKGTMGERLFLARDERAIPAHHRRWGIGLAAASALGLPFFIWGLWAYDLLVLVLGMVLLVSPKLWFVDRMVWLYEDMTRNQR